MEYRNDRQPKNHAPPPQQRARIVDALGSKEAAAAWMEAHTMIETAAQFSVTVDAVKIWERRIEARCKRTCRTCHEPFPYADMHINGNGEAKQCRPCASTPRVKVNGREAELAEYRLIPQTIYRWLRVPISSDTGYWPRYATRAEA